MNSESDNHRLVAPATSAVPAAPTSKKEYNTRLLWPDMIKTPDNTWTFSCKEIIEKLGTNPQATAELKRNMEKCLIYFYTVKKILGLFDHTYTASCILFFRYWYVYGLPPYLPDCIHIAQAILVTACKTVENNRPVDAYIKATCDYFIKETTGLRVRQNMDKLKWDVRDRLISNEKRILCCFGFDLNLENPKELIEEMFSGFYRFNRDYNLPNEFKQIFPRILQEARNFLVQAVTQPVSLLCDGYSFVALALIYCGLQYKKSVDIKFQFPVNFFRDKFPVLVTAQRFGQFFNDYRVLEENFFDLKSNKREKLQISVQEIDELLNEEPSLDGEVSNPYDSNLIKSGEVRQELKDHIHKRIREIYERTVAETKKRMSPENVADLEQNKKLKN
ncbi:Bur2p [Zygosaccharomyces mellis]|uniref:Bur2p n=1 Tax=Zygosaccharomyces mellis TaxID=42258 RepID=A0A4C2E2F4_9SACH|nr:Bur2p [Zygosaccharomyces mellis]